MTPPAGLALQLQGGQNLVPETNSTPHTAAALFYDDLPGVIEISQAPGKYGNAFTTILAGVRTSLETNGSVPDIAEALLQDR